VSRKFITIFFLIITSHLWSQENVESLNSIYSFGQGGNLKMLYDRRQRPQVLKLGDILYLVYNGNRVNLEEKPKTIPMITSFNVKTKKFGPTFSLDNNSSSDHHHCPIIWLDDKMKINVVYGTHNSPGYHLISKNESSIGRSKDDWVKKSFLDTKISYPSYSKSAYGDLVYFREGGHTGHWKYAIKQEETHSWAYVENTTTNLDMGGMFEWSSYHSIRLSHDRKFIHIAFISYDDNKENNPGRYFNERYNTIVTNDFKYNLYYLRVDLKTQKAYNFSGKQLILPIDLHSANKDCIVWNTQGRGAGIPPEIIIDKNGNPAFLHLITEKSIDDFNYYFVQFLNGEWVKSPIRTSNHQWNNGGILYKDNKYFSYLIVGDKVTRTKYDDAINFLKKNNLKNWIKINEMNGHYMDKHGDGDIEEWVSIDGINWEFSKKITPINKKSKWKFNNIQFINDFSGEQLKECILFYGWEDSDPKKTSAFIYLEN